MNRRASRARVLGVGILVAYFAWIQPPLLSAADRSLLLRESLADPSQEGELDRHLTPIIGSGEEDEDQGEARGEESRRSARIIGTSLFGSGLFLCSWGIASWQTREHQCCPTRNTENVLKIVVGVVLINAGLVYLIGATD